MSAPRPGDVLRALAKAATEPYAQQANLYQQQQPPPLNQYQQLGMLQPAPSNESTIAYDTARTCAHSFARALIAVADLFDAAEQTPPEQQR